MSLRNGTVLVPSSLESFSRLQTQSVALFSLHAVYCRGVTLPLCSIYHATCPAVDLLCCPTGGTMYSEKDLTHATQTLGDHDPGSCMSKWNKTRFMRHALVIR